MRSLDLSEFDNQFVHLLVVTYLFLREIYYLCMIFVVYKEIIIILLLSHVLQRKHITLQNSKKLVKLKNIINVKYKDRPQRKISSPRQNSNL